MGTGICINMKNKVKKKVTNRSVLYRWQILVLHTTAWATDPFIQLFPDLVDHLKEHEDVTDEIKRCGQPEASLEVHDQIVQLELPNFLRFSLYFCCGGTKKCQVNSLLNMLWTVWCMQKKFLLIFSILKNPLLYCAFFDKSNKKIIIFLSMYSHKKEGVWV